ncbi:DUF222 domain-containing protein [Microbacterium sp.]|uniref:HNH endonuclease signature motif containing protein n=1 Tax=Microbacterium sp. TaxID=51671 RepID=UPI0039E5B659
MTNTAIGAPHDVQGGERELLDALAATRRERAALDAKETVLLARAVDLARSREAAPGPSSVRDLPLRSLAAQIGAMWRASDRTVERQMSHAAVLVGTFPATHAALEAGEISRAHASVIVDAGLPLPDDDTRARYEAAVLQVARRETPGRLRPAARLLANRLHPIPLDARHAAAATARNVWVRDLDDGMAELIATLPAVLAHGIRHRLDQYARREVDARGRGRTGGSGGGQLRDGDTADLRGLGEIRADVFTDLLLTGHATPEVSNASMPEGEAIVARVQVTVPVLTVLGSDVTPAELVGHAPIDTPTALRLAGAASGWDRILTHPVTEAVLGVDRYRPTDQLKRALRVRDEHCRFPGCRIPTHRCDIDHTVARAHDGPTGVTNLAHLCRRHHTLKHHSAWRVRQTGDGVLHWTSPTGRVYPDRPARTLAFVSDCGTENVGNFTPENVSDSGSEPHSPPPF